jgi:hypothetical protein
MDQRFLIKIDGRDVSPETVRLRDLVDVLRNYELAIGITAGLPIDLHLVEIFPQSADCMLAVQPSGFAGAVVCAQAIANRDLSPLPEKARESIREIQAKARKQNWRISMGGIDGVKAEIDADTEFLDSAVIRGRSSLVAQLVRIGGTPVPTAHFLYSDNRRFTAAIATPELAVDLAPRLYRVIEVHGEAYWSTGSLRLVKFKITEIGSYDDRANMAETLRELSAIAGDYWDDIDPDEYIADLRAG